MSVKGKYSECKRRLHLDFHNPAGIPDIAVDFDAAEFAQTVKRAGFDGVTVFAMDAHGYCYFPTEKGRQHPSLRQDLLGGMVRGCREEGLKVGAYVSVGCNDHAMPEWLQIDKNGKPRTFLEQGGYQMVCINSPHVAHNILPITVELLERYELDAIWYDMLFFFDDGCRCRYCLEYMAKAGRDPDIPVDMRQHMCDSINEFVNITITLKEQMRPEVEMTYNGLSIHERPGGLAKAAYVDVEALATGGWGYFYIPTKVRYLRTLGKPVTGMTSAFHRSWGDFGTIKAQAMLEHEVYTILAAGGTVAIGDQMHPRGKLETARYERIGEVLNPVALLEEWIDGATPLAEAAILLYPLAQGQFPGDSWVGACKLLMECKIQFETIDTESDWSNYKLIIVPDACYTDAKKGVKDKIQNYLKNGGSILASGDVVEVLPNSIVTRLEGGGSSEPAYLKIKGNWAKDIPDIPHVLMSGYQLVEAPECEVLATLVAPYASCGLELQYSSRQVPYCTHKENPVIVKNDKIVYIASSIFREYSQYGYGAHRQILTDAIKLLLPEPLVKGNFPLSFELAIFRKERRIICFIVPYSPVRGDHVEQIEEWPTYSNLSMVIRGEFKNVYSMPGKVCMDYRQEGAYTMLDIVTVRGPTVIIFEK